MTTVNQSSGILEVDRQRILVTGSNGLIGGAVISALAGRGAQTRGIDIRGIRGSRGDILDPVMLRKAMAGVTGVIHLAAVSRVIWGERDPTACLKTNVEGTQGVIECLRDVAPHAWLVLASSREIYGQSARLPVTEDQLARPMNTYARSKLAAERAVENARHDGLRAAILRFSTVYGTVTDPPDRLVPAFCRAAIEGRALHVEGTENCVDITHVRDVARAITDVAERLCAGAALPVMHLTTGSATPLVELARMVIDLARSRSPIRVMPPRHYDVSRFVGDPSRATACIGWQPRIGLEAGITELIDAIRAQARQPAPLARHVAASQSAS